MSTEYPFTSKMPIFKNLKKFKGIKSPIVGVKVENNISTGNTIIPSPTNKYTKGGYAINKHGVPLDKNGVNVLTTSMKSKTRK